MKRQKAKRVSDKEFFEQNPGRRYRVRQPAAGELAEMCCTVPRGAAASILVEQLRPGLRVRRAWIHASDITSAEISASDDDLSLISESLYERYAAPGLIFVSLQEGKY